MTICVPGVVFVIEMRCACNASNSEVGLITFIVLCIAVNVLLCLQINNIELKGY